MTENTMDFPTLSTATRDFRWGRIRAMAKEMSLDCVLVFGLKGRERFEGYVANEYVEGMAILPVESDPVLLTWNQKMVIHRMGSKTDQDQFWIKDARIGAYGPGIVEVIHERGLEKGRIGAVGVHVREAGNPEGIVPYPMWKAVLDGLPDADLVDTTWEFRRVMLGKNDEELAMLRHSAAVGEKACQAMLDTVRVGASEYDIYAAIQDEIHKGGAIPHDPFLIMTWGADDLGWSEPTWTQSGGLPRLMEPGDLFMVEMFPTYGGLETQQQLSVAVAPVEPITQELGKVANDCYLAGTRAMRPGKTFNQLVEAMLAPLDEYGGWTLTPMIHSVSPLGWTGGMGFNREKMPNHLTVPSTKQEVQYQNFELVLEEGMSFAFEPNACFGQNRVNVGGSLVVTADEPEELNSLANRLHIVEN